MTTTKTLATTLLVALVTATAIAAAPASALAARQVQECSASPVVRTPVQAPKCATAPVTCPAAASCELLATVTVAPLVGVGASSGDVTVYGPDPSGSGEVGLRAFDVCHGPSSGCSVTVAHEPQGRAVSQDFTATCGWREVEVALFARVTCRLELAEI